MRKFSDTPTASRPRRGRSLAPRLLLLALLIAFSPVLYEGGQLFLARWEWLTGISWEPRTPVLDALAEWSRTAHEDVRLRSHRLFSSGSWRASTAVPAAIVWALLMGVLFFRRVR